MSGMSELCANCPHFWLRLDLWWNNSNQIGKPSGGLIQTSFLYGLCEDDKEISTVETNHTPFFRHQAEGRRVYFKANEVFQSPCYHNEWYEWYFKPNEAIDSLKGQVERYMNENGCPLKGEDVLKFKCKYPTENKIFEWSEDEDDGQGNVVHQDMPAVQVCVRSEGDGDGDSSLCVLHERKGVREFSHELSEHLRALVRLVKEKTCVREFYRRIRECVKWRKGVR